MMAHFSWRVETQNIEKILLHRFLKVEVSSVKHYTSVLITFVDNTDLITYSNHWALVMPYGVLEPGACPTNDISIEFVKFDQNLDCSSLKHT